MRVLELLAFTPMSAPQVAAALDAQPRTVRRVLTRLVADDYLTTREDGRRRLYEPTMRLVALAGQVVENSHLARVGRPHVELLRERSGATVHLLVPSYLSALCLVHAEVPDAEPSTGVRELVPAHCTAGGRVLLAWREQWRESVLAAPLDRFTPTTVVDPPRLGAWLDETRAAGYAIEAGEYREGLGAAAVPVLVGGEAVAALACSAPLDEVDPATLLPLVTRVGSRLTRDLERR